VIGRLLPLSSTSSVEVVGVLEDIEDDVRDGRTLPTLYTFLPEAAYAPVLLVRFDEKGSVASVQSVLQDVWGSNRVSREIIDLEDVAWRASAGPRAQATLMGVITALSLPILVIGVVGAVRYAIQQQTREYAVRLALGADHPQLRRAAVGRLLLHTVFGAIGGLAVGTAALVAAAPLSAVVATLDTGANVAAVSVVIASVLVASLFGVTPLRDVEPVRLLRESI
jgi:ABC-type antimicrobial peptide transport system permease subunit